MDDKKKMSEEELDQVAGGGPGSWKWQQAGGDPSESRWLPDGFYWHADCQHRSYPIYQCYGPVLKEWRCRTCNGVIKREGFE